jgi:aspartyl-tRNA(Asn)/glutamyl-tRNA(Gln) amidotransferase subunit A
MLMNATQFIKDVQSGSIDIVEYTNKVIDACKNINKEYNYLNTISEELALQQAKALKSNKDIKKMPLAGLPLSVKDAICVKGVESTAGSDILRGYKPLFNATCIQRAIDAGAIIIGKTAQDEFGFGSFSANVGVGFETPKNPFDKKRACGGSSGGSAGLSQLLAQKKINHASLGESTGGSIVEPASFCGVVGLCPTYGRVSRYGLIDYGNSLDKIGPIGSSTIDTDNVLKVISGHDPNDSTSARKERYSTDKRTVKGMKLGILKDAFGEGTDESIKKAVWDAVKNLESEGATYEEIKLEFPAKQILSAYYIIAMSEASTNLAKYCGMRYGASDKLDEPYNEYFTKLRTKHFGKEAKQRAMLGTFMRTAGYRGAYYIKAMKARTLIINDYKKLLKKYNLLVSPTAPELPPTFEEIKKMTPIQEYNMDILTVGPNLAGLPHINTPVGSKDSLPIGALFTADHFNEADLTSMRQI